MNITEKEKVVALRNYALSCATVIALVVVFRETSNSRDDQNYLYSATRV